MYIYFLRQGLIGQLSSCYDKISDFLKQFLKIKKRLQHMQTPRGGNLSRVLLVAIIIYALKIKLNGQVPIKSKLNRKGTLQPNS
jgi:hypothetical protein